MDSDTVVRGAYVAPEMKEQFESLRAFFDAKASLDRIDSYGKWIFASSAIVGALGAGLSNRELPRVHAGSLLLLTASIVCLGVSLVAASQSIAPQVVEVSLNDLGSMREAVNGHFRSRQRLVSVAARFYALAIFLAALVPLVSVLTRQNRPRLSYVVDAKGVLAAEAQAGGMKQGDALELDVERAGVAVTSAGVMVDSSGEGGLHVGPVALEPGDTAVVVRQKSAGKGDWMEVERISVRR
ncbi:MAG: hypothetical protein M3Y50_02420 [Acidobacteriota bacterium]|nr:hypothetical protein [Acidobacteriota bacterium]